MATITWITQPALGTIPELDYYETPLQAVSSDDSTVEYFLLSGTPPGGIQVRRSGAIQGVPVLTDGTNGTSLFFFTVRAISDTGAIADRGFIMRVHNLQGVIATPRNVILDEQYDGSPISYQLQAVSANPYSELTWRILDSTHPVGLSVSSTGLLSGVVLPNIQENSSQSGYDVIPNDFTGFDVTNTDGVDSSKEYSFRVEVTDGYSSDIATVSIRLLSRAFVTSDKDRKSVV